MSWTDERIDRLKTMWAEGSTASHIAELLGGVSRNAVIGKAHRLGLESRPSPVKAAEEKGNKAKAAAPPAAAPKPAPPSATVKITRYSMVVIAGAHTVCMCTLKNRLTSLI